MRRAAHPDLGLESTPHVWHTRRVPLSELIGRELELERLHALVGRSRLVTLVGPGGIGKTRLALELAERTAAEWPGGVQRVELAAITSGHDLGAELAA